MNNNGIYTLDFSVTDSKHFIEIKNLSAYAATPERPQFSIKAPGFAVAAFVPADPYGVTEVSTQALNLSKAGQALGQLADGIYEIAYEICPYEQFCVVKHHFRSYQIEKTLGQMVMDFSPDCAPRHLKNQLFAVIQQADILITGIRAALDENQSALAARFLSQLNLLLKRQNQTC